VRIPALKGKVQTVLGTIEPSDVGITLPHEHLINDGTTWVEIPDEIRERVIQPITLDTLWWVRYHPFHNLDDRRLVDEDEAVEEVLRFKEHGGATVVEVTSIGLGRDPQALDRIARATGLNVVMGSGYYVGPSQPSDVGAKTEEAIAAEIMQDIVDGVDDTGICAGIIGEIGTSWPITANEIKSLVAAAWAQEASGAALTVHPGQHEDACARIVDILDQSGADLSRTVLCHVDRAVREPQNRLRLAEKGCYLEYDLFGMEGYYPMYERLLDVPNDAQRLNEILELVEAGFADQVLLSHDIWGRARLCKYGGWGYAHILRDTLPVMWAKGFSEELIDTLLVENPKRLLTFV